MRPKDLMNFGPVGTNAPQLVGSDTDRMLDVYMTHEQREAYERLRKDAERYRRLRHKMTCGSFTKDEEQAVLGAKDAASFDAVMDAMNGANTQVQP